MIGRTTLRYRSIGALFVLLFLFSALSMAQEWWETKPYLQWSAEQVHTILNNSPWTIVIQSGVRPLGGYVDAKPSYAPGVTYPVSLLPIAFRVSLITARPVREALLRSIEWSGTSLNARDYQTDAEEDRLERFIAAYPDDIRVKGDDQFIIVALTLRVLDINNCYPVTDRTCQNWLEEPKADELFRIDLSKLTAQTSLATNTNRVALVRYEPPGLDGLGAKYYFPRTLANGAPLIAAADKDLTFETRIDKSKVKAKFNLRKMAYNEKPET